MAQVQAQVQAQLSVDQANMYRQQKAYAPAMMHPMAYGQPGPDFACAPGTMMGMAAPVDQHMMAAEEDQNTVGGVSAKLDYDLPLMADFLSSMACAVIKCKLPLSLAFKKFTSQILSSTRLPCSTIILALVYLSKRCEAGITIPRDPSSVYKLLIVSLLLANKFNDDNTFTNKSWAEVTGMPIADLTKIEAEWLVAVEWKLNLKDHELQDWNKWLQRWKCWNQAIGADAQVTNTLKQRLVNAVMSDSAEASSIDSMSVSSGVNVSPIVSTPTSSNQSSPSRSSPYQWYDKAAAEQSPSERYDYYKVPQYTNRSMHHQSMRRQHGQQAHAATYNPYHGANIRAQQIPYSYDPYQERYDMRIHPAPMVSSHCYSGHCNCHGYTGFESVA
ncbi:uncharacterized protein V1510DRAFT_218645 [Dipodascopsis tothii]|uniref:uncharacterized protein n=1 Tax=Dipodascopsis tothii TaxID=44089 RepID=UPI0034CD453A